MNTHARFIGLLSMLFLFTLAFAACEKEEGASTATGGGTVVGGTPEQGQKASEFSLQDTEGNTVALSSYQGKVVTLFFLGSGCASCRAIAPTIQTKLVEAYENRDDFQVLALDQWNGNLAAVKGFKEGTGLMVPFLLDAGETAKSYSTAYDRLIVIDKEGYVRFSGQQLASNDLESAIQVITNYLDQ